MTNSQVFVDALGPTKQYEQFLTSQFPGINFTVAAKADSKYTIVGAASVAAKVTRDAWIEGWVFEEDAQQDTSEVQIKRTWSTKLGSGYPSGTYLELIFHSYASVNCAPQTRTRRRGSKSLSRRHSDIPLSHVFRGRRSKLCWRRKPTK